MIETKKYKEYKETLAMTDVYDKEFLKPFSDWVDGYEHAMSAVKNNAVLPNVSISLLCINDAVEGEGLTEDKYYDPICKYEDCYCIVDDNDELEIYHEGFFKVVSNEC